jgi:hypothetical protein
MSKIFELTDDIKQVARDAIDDLIEALGKQCQLIYASGSTQCPNCVYDNFNKRSANKYKPGGPQPFSPGQTCPVCGGSGVLPGQTNTEIIKMLCTWNPREFTYIPDTIETPYSILQTKGYIEDLPKVMRCKEMILEIPIEPYTRFRFVRNSEPIDPGNIIQGEYFVCLWKRAG